MKCDSLIAVINRQLRQMCRQPVYVVAILVIPLTMSLFFLSLLGPGLPDRTPTAIVDLDNSSMSREIGRNLNAMSTINISHTADSYSQAIDMMNSGEIYGFFLIPDDFEQHTFSGLTPTLSYYCNMAYYIPGTLTYKGFKTIAVSTSGAVVKTTLLNVGIDERQVESMLQPIVIQDHPIGNPWTNYAIYLCNSFIPGLIALMVMMITAYSVCIEIKQHTSRQWLLTANGNIYIALLGKLLPQTTVFIIVGTFIQSLLWSYSHFPLNCNALTMITAMTLLIVACQAFALTVCCIVPNLRLSLSIVSLFGILSFSIAGLSFPVESMYGSIGIFSHIIPLRHYFLIYIDQALNGIDIYYSRIHFVALLAFPLVAAMLVWRLKPRLSNPIYIP